jgi:hypothetical protein
MASAVRPEQTAARWRGGLVGACSAAVAIGAHGVGGGTVPGGAALAMLILGCAVVGVVAGGALGHGIGAVTVFLVVGQAVGHLTLALAAGHAHGPVPSPSMLFAHLGAAAVCAGLICVAERLWSALGSCVWRLVRTLTVAAPADQMVRLFVADTTRGISGIRLGCTAGTRGPPPVFV